VYKGNGKTQGGRPPAETQRDAMSEIGLAGRLALFVSGLGLWFRIGHGCSVLAIHVMRRIAMVCAAAGQPSITHSPNNSTPASPVPAKCQPPRPLFVMPWAYVSSRLYNLPWGLNAPSTPPAYLVENSGMLLGRGWIGLRACVSLCLLAHDGGCVLREYHHVVYHMTNALTLRPLHPPPSHLHRTGEAGHFYFAACRAWDWQGADGQTAP